MKRHTRIIGLITLLIFVSGCSGYRAICFPNSDGQKEMHKSPLESSTIQSGDHVVIILTDGKKAEGKVRFISPQGIILTHDGRTLHPRGFPMKEVYSIERTDAGAKAITAMVGVTAGILIAGGLIAYNETSQK
jgi:hypothetical protein